MECELCILINLQQDFMRLFFGFAIKVMAVHGLDRRYGSDPGGMGLTQDLLDATGVFVDPKDITGILLGLVLVNMNSWDWKKKSKKDLLFLQSRNFTIHCTMSTVK